MSRDVFGGDSGGGGGAGPYVPPATEAWIDITNADMSNGWTAAYPDDALPQYRKRPDGIVEMRGAIKPGVFPGTIFTLPVGYRHDLNLEQVFAVAAQHSEAFLLMVMPTGEVKSYPVHDGVTLSSIFWVSLSNIRYSID